MRVQPSLRGLLVVCLQNSYGLAVNIGVCRIVLLLWWFLMPGRAS